MVKRITHRLYEERDPHTLFKVHNIFPITFSLVTFVAGFIFQSSVFGGRVQTLSDRQDFQIYQYNELTKQFNNLQTFCHSTGAVKGVNTLTPVPTIRQVK